MGFLGIQRFKPTEACSNTRNLKAGKLLGYKHGHATLGITGPHETQLFICKVGTMHFLTGQRMS